MAEATKTEQGQIAKTTNPSPVTACCGGPAPQGTNACCVRDAEAKSTGAVGCGCASVLAAPKRTGCCG